MSSSLLQPEERVLSTLNADGSRRWLNPRVSKGRLWQRRRIVAWALIFIFVSLPHIYIGGRQWVLLDVAHREFTIFGRMFYPTDTLLLALALISVFVTIFFFTAVLGRVWCGWACPQTVYLEFVFRPIDRLFEGKKGAKGIYAAIGVLPKPIRRLLRFAVYFILAFFLAHTFLAYFVGSHELLHWVTGPPADHPFGIGIVALVTVAMLFDFLFFREQLCLVACPYGRFQSVMLDRSSLIVGYDEKRGEPRGKARRAPKGDVHLKTVPPEQELGDCVDCTMCVQVCPTGIDIRNGLQMECIHCAQCIDACNSVMTKLGRAPGLIRYSSQSALQRAKRGFLRPRVIVYPLILTAALGGLVLVAASKTGFDATLVRRRGQPFNTLPSGEVTNQGSLRITNRTKLPQNFTINPPEGVVILSPTGDLQVEPGEMLSVDMLVAVRPEYFAGHAGVRTAAFIIDGDQSDKDREVDLRLLGPMNIKAQNGGAE